MYNTYRPILLGAPVQIGALSARLVRLWVNPALRCRLPAVTDDCTRHYDDDDADDDNIDVDARDLLLADTVTTTACVSCHHLAASFQVLEDLEWEAAAAVQRR